MAGHTVTGKSNRKPPCNVGIIVVCTPGNAERRFGVFTLRNLPSTMRENQPWWERGVAGNADR